MTVFVYSALTDEANARLRERLPAGHNVIFRKDLPENEQVAAFQQADFLLGNPPADWFDADHRLQWWQLDSAGFDKYAEVQLAIPVTNMGDYFAWPCAETIVAGIMAFYRDLPELAVLQQEKKWVGAPLRFKMSLLKEKKVIILGAGTIGQAVREMLTGFRCSINMLAKTNPAAELHTPEDLKAALPETDLVVNCLPGSAKGFFSAELIGSMKKKSLYANVGRGTTNDEGALVAALQRGQLAGAVLDVTEIEPLPADSPLWTMPNVILTQHTGGGLMTEDDDKVDLFLQNLDRILTKEPLNNVIDLSRGY